MISSYYFYMILKETLTNKHKYLELKYAYLDEISKYIDNISEIIILRIQEVRVV